MIAYPESFLCFISSQSDRPPAGIFRSELNRARAIRDGKLAGGRMLPQLFEFPHDIAADRARWSDPANWPMVSPNRGRSITIPRLIEDYQAATAVGEEEVRRWASQHLNIEIGVGLHVDNWAGAEIWHKGVEPGGLTLQDVIARSEICCIGVDGGGADDLLGIAVLGREAETRTWLLWGHAYVSSLGVERRRANRALYGDFNADGDLDVIDPPDDLAAIVEIVGMVKTAGKLAQVGVDPLGIGALVDELAEIGVTAEAGYLTGIRQGIALSGAVKTVERKLSDGSLRHSGSRMMNWCAGNARIQLTPTAMRVARDETGAGKIDPLMAAFNAIELMSSNPAGPPKYQMFVIA
jgi:phage terminase large subunit-like protein